MNLSVQHIIIAILPIEENGISIVFLLEYSTAQGAYT